MKRNSQPPNDQRPHGCDAETNWHNNRGSDYIREGNLELALYHFQQFVALCESRLGTNHESTATSYNNLAAVYYQISDYDRAMHYVVQASQIYERTLGTSHSLTKGAYENIAMIYQRIGNRDKATEFFKKAKPLTTLGPEDFTYFGV